MKEILLGMNYMSKLKEFYGGKSYLKCGMNAQRNPE
ncbi:putative aspartyl protease [Clostridium beijerinckii]|uniref:Aspartyl protease n=1 Tax=Clostridium beijerinckii TaxID=1520 RepID=A0AAX0B4J9_CLOBE|nr:putative aspartyl protease [Clostridium beijerinckii]